jgi:hypothetical protein
MIHFGKMTNLEKLILDNPIMSCQENTYSTVIREEEWVAIDNSKMEIVLINSDNLTLDYIDYMVKQFTGLKLFIMGHLVLTKLEENIIGGYDEKDKIIFRSYEDKSSYVSTHKPLKIRNLIKNKYQAPFSDSMLNIIKERNPTQYQMYSQKEM